MIILTFESGKVQLGKFGHEMFQILLEFQFQIQDFVPLTLDFDEDKLIAVVAGSGDKIISLKLDDKLKTSFCLRERSGLHTTTSRRRQDQRPPHCRWLKGWKSFTVEHLQWWLKMCISDWILCMRWCLRHCVLWCQIFDYTTCKWFLKPKFKLNCENKGSRHIFTLWFTMGMIH